MQIKLSKLIEKNIFNEKCNLKNLGLTSTDLTEVNFMFYISIKIGHPF